MIYPDSKVHGANMGPTWVLLAPDGPHVGPMNLAIWVMLQRAGASASIVLHGANMGPTWVLSAPDGPHVGPMNLAIWVMLQRAGASACTVLTKFWLWYFVSYKTGSGAGLLSQFCPFHCSQFFSITKITSYLLNIIPDCKVYGANMGPTWGWQDPGGPHVGPINLAISDVHIRQKLLQLRWHLPNMNIMQSI